MCGASTIKPLLQSLEENQENIKVILDEFIKNLAELFKSNEVMQKEYHRLFQNSSRNYKICIDDLDLVFGIKILNNGISYFDNLNENTKEMTTINLGKDCIISILKGTESFSTLYMKGKISIKEGFSEAIKVRNLLSMVLSYI